MNLLPRLLLALLTFLFPARAAFAQVNSGYIQVVCEPNLQVFLDNTFKGDSNLGQGGLILTEVRPGKRAVKVVKSGFSPQTYAVDVEAGGIVEIRVRPFVPDSRKAAERRDASKSAAKKTGMLLIQSLPLACKVSIQGFEAGSGDKTKDKWRLNEMPPGYYNATFRALGKSVQHRIKIEENRLTHLLVNILDGTVRDVGVEQSEAAKTDMAAGLAFTLPGLGLKMMPVQPGSFLMGADKGDSDERPATNVTLSRMFWLGRTEVSQVQYSAVMGLNPSNFKGDNLPVEQVTWEDAVEFCRRLTEREQEEGRLPEGYVYALPTEAQWEYACRAGTTEDYAGELSDLGWYDQNSGNHTQPVGQKQANAWGFHDMHGNVWEWCLDPFGSYRGGEATDPINDSKSLDRVNRGGSWWSSARACRSAKRNSVLFDRSGNHVGFRLALSAAQ